MPKYMVYSLFGSTSCHQNDGFVGMVVIVPVGELKSLKSLSPISQEKGVVVLKIVA